jgi:C-terminal processing protease CtpA/Prc
LRSWTHHLYLWYGEAPDLNPVNYTSTAAYFDLLKTSALTPSGQPKDRFHFTYPTAEWEALSQTGVEPGGYGLRWEIFPATSSGPARVLVAYLEPGATSPAAQAGLTRGAEVSAVNGIALENVFTQAQANTVNSGLFPNGPGQTHSFTVRDRNGTVRSFNMQSVQVTTATVQSVGTYTDGMGKAGYMLFNDHLATAEDALIDAVNILRTANITDLVLDIRYNGGGYLAIASQLAYMIAGNGPTAGRTFERSAFNDKHTATNPVTGNPLQPTPFYTTTVGLGSRPAGQSLPTLNLTRVFVLTGVGTCSASEAVINGLRGVDVEVIQIGATTCGKPYGFYPADNCGTTYFSIQCKAVNARDFGDYTDGFSPQNTSGLAGVRIPGCSVADDFSRDLGHPLEARLAAALSYRFTQSCPAPSAAAPRGQVQAQSARAALPWFDLTHAAPWRENRILVDLPPPH